MFDVVWVHFLIEPVMNNLSTLSVRKDYIVLFASQKNVKLLHIHNPSRVQYSHFYTFSKLKPPTLQLLLGNINLSPQLQTSMRTILKRCNFIQYTTQGVHS